MKIIKLKIRKIYCLFVLVYLAGTLLGCSYGMDALEGAITERASFSIDAFFNSPDTVEVSWSELPDAHFAGYEVYMTTRAWDEYGSYELVAAKYLINNDIPSWITFEQLGDYPTNADITVNPTDADFYPGEYYVRVGLVYYDEKPEDERSDPEVPEWYGDGEADYVHHSTLKKVSGYDYIYIYME